MIENQDLNKESINPKSMLNVEGQKEYIDYALKASRKNTIKTLLVVFPVLLIFILATIGVLFYFTGLIKF